MLKRLTSLLIPILVLGVLVNEILNTPIYTDRELASFRERDIALAKNGQFDEALEALKALSEIVPNDPLVWGDYLTVMIWAHRDGDAVQLANKPGLPPLPNYVLAELFEAALRIGDTANAQRFAIAEIGRSDNPEKVAVTRIDRLREMGAEPFIGALITAGLKRVPNSAPLLMRIEVPKPPETEAVAAVEPVPAAVEPTVDKALEQPSKPLSVKEKSSGLKAPKSTLFKPSAHGNAAARPLRRAGVPVIASRTATAKSMSRPIAEAPNARANAAEQARQAVQAAEQAPVGTERIVLADRALAALDTYIELLQAEAPSDSGALRNAQLDRVRALTLANRLPEAAALFESLGDPQTLPLYGLLNGADVYSRLHQPERAERLLDIARAQAPNDSSVLSAVFYNQLDRERYDLAQQTLAQLQSQSGPDVVDGRASWVARLAAMFEAYQNHLAIAQERLEALRIHALNDPDLDMNLATVYRWRGWAARALEEYRKAGIDGADPVAARAGVANSQMDLQRFREAGTEVKALTADAPTQPDAIAAQKRWDWFNRYEYRAQVATGKSSDSAVTGSSDLTFDQWLYSKPIFDQYRLFAHQHYDWADFSEGSGSADRLAFGGDYRSEPLDLAVSATDRIGAKLGVSANGEWRPDAYWSVFGDAQSDSDLVPLRGSRAGVDGHSFSVGVGYRWNESRSARLAFSRAEFSTGEYDSGNEFESNTRQAVSASISQGVWSDAKQRVAVTGELYYSHNTAGDNVIYFNPSSDRAAQFGVDYNGILARHFERVWSHRFNVGLGVYEQQGFDLSPIWSAQYEQRWEFGPQFSVNYGAMYRSRVYDGGREGYTALFGGIQWRF